MQGNAQYIRAQMDDASLMRLRVRITNDAGTWFDITDRFGESPDYTRIKSIPVFTLGAEQSSPRTGTAFVPQATDITLDNEDGWWNGRVNKDLAHRCRADVKDSVGFYNSVPLTDGDLTDDDTATYAWKSEIDTDNDIWVAHNSKNTIKWTGAQQYWPTGWTPQRFKLQYGSDADGWTDIMAADYTATTNVTLVADPWYSADARRTAFVFNVKSGKGLRIVQAEDLGNAGHLNQMAMNISEVTASSTMPRLDTASWKGKQIKFTNYQYEPDLDDWEGVDIVTVVIDDITHPTIDEITLNLRDLGLLLRKKDAGLVKQGLQHWRNRPVAQLLRHLLLQAFTATYVNGLSNIPDGMITQILDDTTQRSASTFGPAATWKAIQSVFDFADIDPRLVCEAVYWHDANSKLYLGYSDYFHNGINAKVYEFDPTTFTFTDVTSVTHSNHSVWYLGWSAANSKLVAVFGDDLPTDTTRRCNIFISTSTITAGVADGFSDVMDSASDIAADRIASCQFCFRNGGTDQWNDVGTYYSIRGIGSFNVTGYGVHYFGENLVFPLQTQYVRSANGEPENSAGQLLAPRGNIDAPTAGLEEGTDFGNYTHSSECYRTWSDFNTAGAPWPAYPDAFEVKFTLGQRRCIDLGNDYVFFVDYNSATTTYSIKWYRISTDQIDITHTWATASVQPTALCAAPSGDYVYWAEMIWDDTESATPVVHQGTLHYYSRGTVGVPGVSQSTYIFNGTEEYMIPIALRACGSSSQPYALFGCILHRDSPTPDGKLYGFKYSPFASTATFSLLDIGSEMDGGFSSANPFLSFGWNGSNSTSDRRCYCVDTASGNIYEFYYTTDDRNMRVANTVGGSAVDGEHDTAVHSLAVDYHATRASEVVYGVSAPGLHANALKSPYAGRYELFKLANEVNYTIPIADFNDLDCWEAIGHIARPIDYVYGFDPGGDFYFRARDDGSSPNDYTFVDPQDLPVVPESGTIKRIAAYMSLDRGYAQIANVVNVKPTTALLGEVKGQGTFQIRPEDVADFKRDIVANQSDSFAHSILLDCVRQGQPVLHTDSTYSQVRFRGFIYRFEISTTLASDMVSGATTAELVDTGYNGLYVSPGDFIIIGEDTLNRISPEFDDITVNANYLSVSLDTGVARAYNAGTKVIIYKQTHMQATDSEYGVTQLEEGIPNAGQAFCYVESAEFLSVDTVILIEDEQMLVTVIEEDSANDRWKLTITRGVSRSPAAAHNTIGLIVKAFWAPSAVDKQFEIFGTGVSLTIRSGAVADTDAETAQNKTFFVGDRIRVESPGLELKEQSKSYAQSRDQTSIDKYGEEEYRGPEVTQNRFMNHVLANEVSKAVLADVKDPHWRPGLTVDKFMNIFLPGDPFYTISQRLYPMETDNKITVEAMQVEMTYPTALQAGRTVFKARAVSSYEG